MNTFLALVPRDGGSNMMLGIFQRRLCLGMHNLRVILKLFFSLSNIHPTVDIFIEIWVFEITVLFLN